MSAHCRDMQPVKLRQKGQPYLRMSILFIILSWKPLRVLCRTVWVTSRDQNKDAADRQRHSFTYSTSACGSVTISSLSHLSDECQTKGTAANADRLQKQLLCGAHVPLGAVPVCALDQTPAHRGCERYTTSQRLGVGKGRPVTGG